MWLMLFLEEVYLPNHLEWLQLTNCKIHDSNQVTTINHTQYIIKYLVKVLSFRSWRFFIPAYLTVNLEYKYQRFSGFRSQISKFLQVGRHLHNMCLHSWCNLVQFSMFGWERGSLLRFYEFLFIRSNQIFHLCLSMNFQWQFYDTITHWLTC